MARTALNAPAHRVLQNIATGSPPGAAPNLDYLGIGTQDHRLPWNTANSATGAQVLGWYGNDPIKNINAVPSTIATANIAALANVVSGTAVTLVSVTGAGITVVPASTVLLPSLVTISSGVAIDGLPTIKRFGTTTTGATGFYDPATTFGRAVSITGVAGGSGGNFLVSGYDCYGYAMSELVTSTAGATTANGKKAFKIITSVVPQFTNAFNYSIGTSDIYGFGVITPLFSDVQIYWNAALISATTGFVVPDVTSPATTTTGDVRGTYAVQSASDGTKRLIARSYLNLPLIQTNATTGLFGQAQV